MLFNFKNIAAALEPLKKHRDKLQQKLDMLVVVSEKTDTSKGEADNTLQNNGLKNKITTLTYIIDKLTLLSNSSDQQTFYTQFYSVINSLTINQLCTLSFRQQIIIHQESKELTTSEKLLDDLLKKIIGKQTSFFNILHILTQRYARMDKENEKQQRPSFFSKAKAPSIEDKMDNFATLIQDIKQSLHFIDPMAFYTKILEIETTTEISTARNYSLTGKSESGKLLKKLKLSLLEQAEKNHDISSADKNALIKIIHKNNLQEEYSFLQECESIAESYFSIAEVNEDQRDAEAFVFDA